MWFKSHLPVPGLGHGKFCKMHQKGLRMGILGSLGMGVYVSATTQYKDLWTVELLGIQVTSSKYMVLEKMRVVHQEYLWVVPVPG